MNILDLGFNYDLTIDFDGDFDGGNYTLKFKYFTSTQNGVGDTETTVILRQSDIDEIYEGTLKLMRLLKPHIVERY